MKEDLLKAIDLALGGEWEASHQSFSNSTTTRPRVDSRGPPQNGGRSRQQPYWYRRAGKMERVDDEPRSELAVIHMRFVDG